MGAARVRLRGSVDAITSENTRLTTALRKATLNYVYDFGDYREHRIKIEKTLAPVLEPDRAGGVVHRIGRAIAFTVAGDELVQVRVAPAQGGLDHQMKPQQGDRVGRQNPSPDLGLGAAQFDTHMNGSGAASGTVSAIMIRTRDQTPPEYLATVKVDCWETVLLETLVQGPRKR